MAMLPKRSPIALAILAMLYESPMHPYRMQRLVKDRGKDEVINVAQRAGVYQTLPRLQREGLIAARQKETEERRPERTVYEITEKGRSTLLAWMRDMLSTPKYEFPEFPAAISFLPLLSPQDVLHQFELRASAIEEELVRMDAQLTTVAAVVPRLFLLETEYLRALQAAELAWVMALIEDLRAGRLDWNEAWLRKITAQFAPDLAGAGR